MIRRTLMGAAAVLALSLGSAGAESLRFAGATPALTMDPHATNDFTTTAIFRQVYDSLVGLDLEMELVPALADNWEYIGDATWRFTVREGVKFHDGSDLTAGDVAFSIMRQKDSRFYRSLFGSITEANVVDDRIVEVVSSAPDPILPRKMSRMFILSQSWAEENDAVEIPDLGAEGAEAYSIRNAMGTGPMQLVSHDPAGETHLTAFDDYWGDRPGNLTEATYLTIGLGPTRVAALLSGEIDLVVDTPLQDIDRIETSPDFSISETAQLLWMQLELDGTRDQALETFDRDGNVLDDNPFRDIRVRQAIAHAVDAEAIVDRVMRGHARVVGIASIPGFGGYQEDMDSRWETDLDRARELLAEAGYADGFVTTMNCPLERYVNTDDICRAAASMLARVGIDVRINGMVWPEFARMLVNGPDSSFHLIGMSPDSRDTQDAFTGYIMTRDPDANEGFFNWALFTDEEIDEKTRTLTETFDENERDELYRDLIERAKEQVNAVYLHQPAIVWAMREGVEAPIRADATVTLQNVTVR
ncbi:ABC transporter substrate-binding protein [Pararhodobacter sp. SW119]|uniref:ABC transporter substrate-binding protein n=1 Tax=Pararhodobacter sp. SW119 TaxID=2780075 RepID=UPI001AE04762|nr:ABC transporter substrate-binding protein [Pararhodobacter sp. SW119]